jgi:hypothetical protein
MNFLIYEENFVFFFTTEGTREWRGGWSQIQQKGHLGFLSHYALSTGFTLIKKKIKFSSYIKEIQNGAVAKSYIRKGFLYEEMRKYLIIYEEAVSHV